MKWITLVAAGSLMSAAWGGSAWADVSAPAELPKTMIWTSYDVGSAGYAEASAMADAFGKQYGTRIRIQPSGSSIGRLQPVLAGRADYGFVSSGAFFAAEGLFDFGTRRWGPQDIRVIAGRPSSLGMPTAANAGIRQIADVKGKRLAYVAGNPSLNVKCDAILAFAGLTRDDVDLRMFPTYSGAMSSLAEGKADATCTTTTPSQMYELAESPRGIYWVPIPPDDAEGWARLREIAPFFAPFREDIGAGISADAPVDMMSYRYPVLMTKADKSDDEVYALIKALDQTFDIYRNATSIISRWALDQSGVPPIDAPFHPGAVRYLEEKGIWTDEMQAWNDDRLERLEALQSAWKETVAANTDADDDAFAQAWARARQQTLDAL